MTFKKTFPAAMIGLLLMLTVSLLSGSMTTSGVFASEEPESETIVQGHAAMFSAMGDNPYIIADIAEEVSPAIVYIHVKWPEQADPPRDPFQDLFDNWFFSPYPSPRGPAQPRQSQGTGFIIDESGTILTNQHVVGNRGDGQTITVTINCRESEGEYEAELVGSDSTLDLAVLQIERETPCPTVTLGDAEAARPGEWVIAIGNPYGPQFDNTVTVGVLSAKGREISIRNPETGTVQVYRNLMQTDAAINRGNSGGPLLNIRGEVIGINTAVHAQAQGIGFAIPINVAKDVLDELIETGGVKHDLPERAWLGIWYNRITEDLAEYLNLPDRKGVVIADVLSGSPAHEAGLRAFDVIRRIDDVDITEEQDLANLIRDRSPGDEIMLTILREGQTEFVRVVLGDMPANMR